MLPFQLIFVLVNKIESYIHKCHRAAELLVTNKIYLYVSNICHTYITLKILRSEAATQGSLAHLLECEMGKQRLRPSLFPGCAPYLTFLSPEEEYEDGQEPPAEMVMHFTAPSGTSPPVLECFQRLGFRRVEVTNLIKMT